MRFPGQCFAQEVTCVFSTCLVSLVLTKPGQQNVQPLSGLLMTHGLVGYKDATQNFHGDLSLLVEWLFEDSDLSLV